MIAKGRIKEAFSRIREAESENRKDKERQFQLDVLRTQAHLVIGDFNEVFSSFSAARRRIQGMSPEEKARQGSRYLALTDQVTERLYQSLLKRYRELDYSWCYRYIWEFSKVMTDKRGGIATNFFWGATCMVLGFHGSAGEQFESAIQSIRQMMKQHPDIFSFDAYFFTLGNRVYSNHMLGLIRRGEIEKAREVEREMLGMFRLPPDRKLQHDAWFSSEVARQETRSRIMADLKPVLDRALKAAKAGDEAALNNVLASPSDVTAGILSKSRDGVDMDISWTMIEVSGDTDLRPGKSRATLDFFLYGQWTRSVARKAEDYALEGLHYDLTVEDIRDVIEQEHKTYDVQRASLLRCRAVFLLVGDRSWIIEDLTEIKPKEDGGLIRKWAE